MAYADDEAVTRAEVKNLIAQLNVDRSKTTLLTDEVWYQGVLAHFNPLFSAGIFDPSWNPEDVFSVLSQELQNYGLTSLEQILTDQETAGAWGTLPLVYIP